MKNIKSVFLFLFLLFSSFILFRFTHSYFSSLSSSNNNVFSASESFPTTIPSVTETITVTLTQTPTQSPTPGPILTNHLVISEVQINGATTTQDFVELYNPTNSNVDLTGWKLRKKTSTGSESSLVLIGTEKSIVSHGFFLWSNSSNGYNSTIGADVSNTNTLAGDNSIALLEPDDTIVDQLGWGSGTNQFTETAGYPTNPAANQSIERKAYTSSTSSSMAPGGSDESKGNGFDSDINSSDFILRTLSQPQNSGNSTETP